MLWICQYENVQLPQCVLLCFIKPILVTCSHKDIRAYMVYEMTLQLETASFWIVLPRLPQLSLV